MPHIPHIERAELREIQWNSQGEAQEINKDRTLFVQFNPQTLRVNYSNQKSGGDQRGGSAIQFVGQGATKLSVELLFDVTAPLPKDQEGVDDVRRLTHRLAYFITPNPTGENDKFIPPGVRFVWGSFLFDGVIDSMNETLEFFSSDGRPLRATASIEVSRQEIQFRFNPDFSGPGARPQTEARAGDSVQAIAGRSGSPSNWKSIAAVNNIENPRSLAPGTLLNSSV